MPEAASARLGLIAPSTTDSVGLLDNQFRALVTQMEAVVGKRATVLSYTPSVSTSGATGPTRPASPQDGDEILVRFAASASPLRPPATQRFRYSTTSSLWEPVGGTPQFQANDTTYNGNAGGAPTTTWAYGSTLDPIVRLNVPYAGTYMVRWGADTVMPRSGGGGGKVDLGVGIGASNPTGVLLRSVQAAVDASFPPVGPVVFAKRVTLSAGAVLTVGWYAYAADAIVEGPWLEVTPLVLA